MTGSAEYHFLDTLILSAFVKSLAPIKIVKFKYREGLQIPAVKNVKNINPASLLRCFRFVKKPLSFFPDFKTSSFNF